MPTGQKLKSYGYDVSGACDWPECQGADDTLSHRLYECPRGAEQRENHGARCNGAPFPVRSGTEMRELELELTLSQMAQKPVLRD